MELRAPVTPGQPSTFSSGIRVGDAGRYEIRQRIGVGGMAEVYKAVDTRLSNRVVALKALSASVAAHPFADKMRKLFIQEAQALSRVRDKNVVDVLDFGAFDDGTPYMVMEFLHGSDLGAFLKSKKQLPVQEAVDIMMGVCAGVHACHMVGIIHRDLKPANIFVSKTAEGVQAKVLDFSVAKVPLSQSSAESERTKTDLIVGTPTYMSPEQALGRPANELSDQYSIGALLYRCLTSRSPQGILPRPREARSEIPEALEEAILRAMDPAPMKRFGSVHELGGSLHPFASADARERWRTYYHTLPQPFNPTTGSISGVFSRDRDGEGPHAPSQVATVAAASYDFGAHERTTRVSPEAGSGAGAEVATEVESAPADRPTTGFIAPTTVDIPLRPQMAGEEAHRVPDQSSQGRTASDTPSAPLSRTRRKIVVGFGLAGAVVVISIVGAVRLAGSRQGRPAPEPPVWTRAAQNATPTAISPAATPTPAAAAAPGTAVVVPTAAADTSRLTPPAVKPRKRKRPAPPPEPSIQYGADGLPIIP